MAIGKVNCERKLSSGIFIFFSLTGRDGPSFSLGSKWYPWGSYESIRFLKLLGIITPPAPSTYNPETFKAFIPFIISISELIHKSK